MPLSVRKKMPGLAHQLIPFTVSLALFMEAVDTTIINTAIPAMSHSLNINPIDLKIALISYLVSLAIFIPISGWIADKFGIKRVFMFALTIFIFASFWCGASRTLLELVCARCLQGFGGSIMVPVGRLIIVREFQRHELVAVMGRVVMVAAIGMMLGPVLGGYITHYSSWRWIFWVNIPIGILTIMLAKRWLVDSPPEPVPTLDKLGFVLFGTGLACLTFGLSALSETNFSHGFAINSMLSSCILLSAYFLYSRHQAHPVVNTKLLGIRTFQISVLGNLLARLSFGGVPFLLPLLLQIGLGYPPQISGLLLAPTAFGVLLIKPFSAQVLRLIGYKRLLILNTFAIGLMLWSFTLITKTTPIPSIACLSFLYGFMMALQYTGMNSLAYADIPNQSLSSATSIMSTIQQLAQSLGVAIGALLLYYYSATANHQLNLTPTVFHHAFFAMGFLTLFSILVFVRLRPDDGKQMLHPSIAKATQASE